MAVSMMEVRIMQMRMQHRGMAMPVAMRLPFRVTWSMFVLVMRVVAVPMRMGALFMQMRMAVALGQMQPDAEGHQKAG